ncbi:MAG: hypothetical protein FWD66_05850 [Paludibacter sp.]|nr:hypothetical protein [Paludibacter sp.]
MIYKFNIVSDESDDFRLVVTIDSGATFLELNDIILKSTKYTTDQITSFYLCNEGWEKEQEITLIEMDTSFEFDNFVMDKTIIEDLVTEEKQKLLFVFDMINDRVFYLTLAKIITGKNQDKPQCILCQGRVPKQIFDPEIFRGGGNSTALDENFFGDSDYDSSELDEDGFSDMDFDDSSLYNDDGY